MYHFDKVVFIIGGQLTAVKPEDQPALDALPRNVPLDVKLRDNPKAVANLKYKILTFLGAVPSGANASSISIQDVAYAAVVCHAGSGPL